MNAPPRLLVAALAGACVAFGPAAAAGQAPPEAPPPEPEPAAEEPPDACPPGGWYCDEGDPAGAGEAVEDDSPPPEASRSRPIVVSRPEQAPAPARRRRPPRWGVHGRVQGVILGGGDGGGDEPHPDAGMAGFGASFRYRAMPELAIDAGLDFFRGVDFDGWRRAETALTGSVILYANPRDPAQVYVLGGLGFSGAVVDEPQTALEGEGVAAADTQYSYFGGHLGMGLELRLSRLTGFTIDGVGFLRSRTDLEGPGDYEYVDSVTGRRTNSSGGGLVRFGLLFSW